MKIILNNMESIGETTLKLANARIDCTIMKGSLSVSVSEPCQCPSCGFPKNEPVEITEEEIIRLRERINILDEFIPLINKALVIEGISQGQADDNIVIENLRIERDRLKSAVDDYLDRICL